MKPRFQRRRSGSLAVSWATALAVICVSLDLLVAGFLTVSRVHSVLDWERHDSMSAKMPKLDSIKVKP